MRFTNIEEEKYVLEFILKNDKNITIEKSKAVFKISVEDTDNSNDFNDVNNNDNENNNTDNNNDNRKIGGGDNGKDFYGIITNEDFEQLYNQLIEEYNITNMQNGNKEFVRIKVEEIIKKEDYSSSDKEDILSDLKDKIMDEIC